MTGDRTFTVDEAAKELGYERYVASFESEDGVRLGDADRSQPLVRKLWEIRGNRVLFQTPDRRMVVIARLFSLD